DLLSVKVSQPDLSHLTVTLKLKSLASLLPATGADSVMWLTRSQCLSTGDDGEESYRIFYLGAAPVAGQAPSYFAGTGTSASDLDVQGTGCVTNTPRNCKIVVYPEESPATGTINSATGTLTVTASLADLGSPIQGDTLFSVTALTFAYITGDPILMDAHPTRPFDYLLGPPTRT